MTSRLSVWTAPLVFLVVCVVSFGLLAPWLGFYQDDWHHVYYASTRGFAGLRELFLYDTRPNTAYVYGLAFALLGFKPLFWHVSLLALRWLTVCAFWLTLRGVWRGKERLALWTGLLFAVYPVFKHQALAVAYTVHWVCYLIYAISLLLMVGALRQKRWFWVLYTFSVLLSALHLFIIEYFAGVEILRLLLLWLLVQETQPAFGKRVLHTLKYYAPYLVVLAVFVAWRAFLLRIPTVDHSNAPVMLYGLLAAPLQTALKLVQMALQDFVALTFSPWHAVFNADVLAVKLPFERWTLLAIVISAVLLALYLLFISKKEEQDGAGWGKTAMLVGAVATVLGPLPGWMIGEQISTQNPLWSDRLGLAAMFGASLFVVGALEQIVAKRKTSLILLSALVGLCIGWHLRTANDYRWEWQKQVNFYWQLAWRAPYIQPHTPILADGELFYFMGYYPTSFAINSMYTQPAAVDGAPYWFFGLYKYFADDDGMKQLQDGKTLREAKFSEKFTGESRDSLVINYKADTSRCLWVLRPQDGDIVALPYITRDAARLADLSRIEGEGRLQAHFADIYGSEPPHDWCYLYQKADLARQAEDWGTVLALWQEAGAGSLRPNHAAELLPFLDGYIAEGDWEEGLHMTLQAFAASEKMRPTLCARWWKVGEETPASTARDDVLTKVETNLECGKLK